VRRLCLFALLVAVLCVVLVAPSSGAGPPLRMEVPSPVEATSPAGASVTYHVKAYDPLLETPIFASCTGGSGSGDFDVTIALPIGSHTIHCEALLADLITIAAHDEPVTVEDTTPPSFSAVSNVLASTSNPAGVVVNYSEPTATDLGESLTVTCAPASGSTFVIGTTPVDCSASDGRGNTGHAFFNVIVTLLDSEAPSFTTVPASSSNQATSAAGAPVSWTIAASDNIDPSPTISCTPSSGSTFPLGTTPVSCTASDDAGNTSAPVSFDVSVVDTIAPTLSLPGNQQVETENPSGTAVTYSASASDTVAGALSAGCSPASGATFPVGTTTVNCSANDGHGNTTPGSFTVTVVLVDHTAPTFSGVSGDISVEANGPGGSIVNFPTPTAADTLDGPIAGVACSPVSGSTFPIGTTTVTCSASDSHGNSGNASFNVIVRDTTPPTLIVPVPRSVYATTPTGVPDTVAGVNSFVNGASATDIVDPSPVVTENAPSFIPVGTHSVIFTARDFSGNGVSREVTLIVLPQPPEGTPPLPVPPPTVTPANVRNLTAVSLNGAIRLRWQRPAGVDHVVITRFVGGTGQLVYSGSAATYLDRGLVNGTEYRYVVASVDAAGNSSAGVAIVAVPRQNLLRSPKDGARLRKPPRLMWAANSEADYFNAQLLQNGKKILSVWPVKNAYQLKKSWKFQGRKYTLKPGVYQWWVWPGFGARSAVDYGELLGTRTFRIVR
jgi:HYR domain